MAPGPARRLPGCVPDFLGFGAGTSQFDRGLQHARHDRVRAYPEHRPTFAPGVLGQGSGDSGLAEPAGAGQHVRHGRTAHHRPLEHGQKVHPTAHDVREPGRVQGHVRCRGGFWGRVHGHAAVDVVRLEQLPVDIAPGVVLVGIGGWGHASIVPIVRPVSLTANA